MTRETVEGRSLESSVNGDRESTRGSLGRARALQTVLSVRDASRSQKKKGDLMWKLQPRGEGRLLHFIVQGGESFARLGKPFAG